MRGLVVFAGIWSCASAAWGADKPVFAPTPPWVKPVDVPALPAKPDGSAIRLLLQDQQVQLEPGHETIYARSVIAIQTPQGLAAGNLSVSWRPETDVFTVHRLQIRRGDKIIDVLASGQTFTVARRETNLDSAMLDGVLTGNIQPEGLQVGDVIDFAASVTSVDPTMHGHVEQLVAAWNAVPMARAHLRMEWPSSLTVRLRPTAAIPALKPVKQGKTTSVELSLDTIEPLALPRGAPMRYQIGRLVEASDYASWSDLAALMLPLYARAATIPAGSPLQSELDRLRTLSTDPLVRTQTALALVQDRVRYVALAMGDGGIVPADAGTTWSRRFGDCKGKTVLLLALLHALNIQAEPVLVSTAFGDGLDQRLPMVALFNHVLVRATIGGRVYWLDGTRTGDRLDQLVVPGYGWGLPLAANATLVRMVAAPLDKPGNEVSIRMDASGGLTVPALTHIETIMRGDLAVATNLALGNLSTEARDRALRDYWKGQYDFIDVRTATASFDAAKGEERLAMDGDAKMDWSSGWYETDGTSVGYKANFDRQPGPDRDAPFAVPYPYYNRTVETIVLPPGFHDFDSDAAGADETAGGIHYTRKAGITGNVFTVERSERSIAPEFAAKDAPAAQAALRALANRTLYLRVPPGYQATKQDTAASLIKTPVTASDFIKRGDALIDGLRYDDAIAAFDQAVALAPTNVTALARRGLAHALKSEWLPARRDLDAATVLDPQSAVVFSLRGYMAEVQERPAEAISAYTAVLQVEPQNEYALIRRATLRHSLGQDDLALVDAAAALTKNPSLVDLYMIRASIFRARNRTEDATTEATRLIAANQYQNYAHVVAARIHNSLGRRAEAMREFDRALAIKPEGYIYVNRANIRDKSDLAGRRTDLDAALKLEPEMLDALTSRAILWDDEGNHDGAITTWTKAIAVEPASVGLITDRGLSQLRAGRTALAAKDFAIAREKAVTADELNNICMEKASAGLALASALTECNAALTKSPEDAEIIDSRAFTLLRMGRIDEAVADYDRALAKVPAMESALYGRAIAWSRKGDKARAAADFAAAARIDPDAAKRFADWGVKP